MIRLHYTDKTIRRNHRGHKTVFFETLSSSRAHIPWEGMTHLIGRKTNGAQVHCNPPS